MSILDEDGEIDIEKMIHFGSPIIIIMSVKKRYFNIIEYVSEKKIQIQIYVSPSI